MALTTNISIAEALELLGISNNPTTIFKIAVKGKNNKQLILASSNQVLADIDAFIWSQLFLIELGYNPENLISFATMSCAHQSFTSMEDLAKIHRADAVISSYFIQPKSITANPSIVRQLRWNARKDLVCQ